MTIPRLISDTRGATALEFGLTAPLFFALLAGLIECGLLFWTQVGLQHGAEMAARCASINTTLCGDAGAVKTYAIQQSLGLKPSTSDFTVTVESCGNHVSANYTYQFLTSYFGAPGLTLNALSCFPK